MFWYFQITTTVDQKNALIRGNCACVFVQMVCLLLRIWYEWWETETGAAIDYNAISSHHRQTLGGFYLCIRAVWADEGGKTPWSVFEHFFFPLTHCHTHFLEKIFKNVILVQKPSVLLENLEKKKLEWGGPNKKKQQPNKPLKIFIFFDKEFAGNRAGKKERGQFFTIKLHFIFHPLPGHTGHCLSIQHTRDQRTDFTMKDFFFSFSFFFLLIYLKMGREKCFFGKVKREKINGQISLLRGGRERESECGIGRFLPCTLKYCCIKCSRTSLYLSVL